MWKRLLNWIRTVTNNMFGQGSFFDKAGIPPNAITTDMAAAIEIWCDLYENKAPWLVRNSKTLSLPSRIASEMATMVTVESEIKVNGASSQDGSNLNARAEFIDRQLDKIRTKLRKQTEYACAKGGLVIKPYLDGEEVSYDFIQADDFYPCAFNNHGDVTSAVFLAHRQEGNTHYTRVEKHTLEKTDYTIENYCYRSQSESDIGQLCSLQEVPEWSSIQPLVQIANVNQPLFAYFAVPLGNTIDPKSPLGVSVYAKIAQSGQLEEADKQYQRLSWEFEAGEMAIDASSDCFKMVRGVPTLPEGKERLFRLNNIDSSKHQSDAMKTFSPNLREAELTSGLNTFLKEIEDTVGLSRGTLSWMDGTQRQVETATEIKMQKQRTYATVSSIQQALESAIRAAVKATDIFITLYNLAPAGDYELAFVWDDSVIVDAEAERQRDREDVAAHLMQPWEYRVKWYGEDAAKAKEMVGSHMTDNELMGFGLPTKTPIPSQPTPTAE